MSCLLWVSKMLSRNGLKLNKSKLKTRFLARRIECLVNIKLAHWDKLKVY